MGGCVIHFVDVRFFRLRIKVGYFSLLAKIMVFGRGRYVLLVFCYFPLGRNVRLLYGGDTPRGGRVFRRAVI